MTIETTNPIVGFFLILFVLAMHFFIDGWCLQYIIEYWASRTKRRPVEANFGLCGLCCLWAPFCFGWLMYILMAAAAITWIASKFLSDGGTDSDVANPTTPSPTEGVASQSPPEDASREGT